MSTTWELIEACFADARTAERLIEDAAARRELRLDPDAALADFVLRRGRASTRTQVRTAVTPRRSRAFTPAQP